MASTEIEATEKWLFDTLAGDAVGVGDRVYSEVAPPDSAYPFVVFQHQGGRDVAGVGPSRIMYSSLWLVKAVDRSPSLTTVGPIARLIDSLLQGKNGANQYGKVLACAREQAFRMTEVDEGKFYVHLGGQFRIFAQAVSA